MRLYFGKTFARWVYQNTNARNESESDQCGDQKIAQFRSHLGEYSLGTHIGQTFYKIFYTFGPVWRPKIARFQAPLLK
jgi:hypothetical protein